MKSQSRNARFGLPAALLGAFAMLTTAPAAQADEPTPYPYIEFNLSFELQNDWNFSSEDSASRHNQLYTTIEPEVVFHLLPGLSIYTFSVFEPVTEPGARESRYFAGQGLYLQDVFLQYEGEISKTGYRTIGFRVWGGKYAIPFGIAWEKAPGVYGTDFAEDYELTERIGFGGAISFQKSGWGKHTLSASVFFLDTSFLSESVFTNRGRTNRAAGGPSNTESLESFHLSLYGTQVPGLDRVGYHIGLVHQNVDGGTAETGLALAVYTKLTYDEFAISPLFEFVHFWNADGVGGQDRMYLTAGLLIERGSWNFSVSGTVRRTSSTGANLVDNLIQTSIGYDFGHNIGLALGYSFRNEASAGTHTVGVLLTYAIGGKLSRRGFRLSK